MTTTSLATEISSFPPVAAPLTSASLKEAVDKAYNRPGLESEFCRPADTYRLFGIKRGLLYSLEKAGLIKTVSLRHAGQVKGAKLVNVASVRAYLHAQMEKTGAAIAGATQKADGPESC